MDLKLAGKRALITGGSKGIGAAAARTMAAEGCDLVLVARGAEALEATAAQIRQDTRRTVETAAVDLSDGANVTALAARFDDIDILVNNASAVPAGNLFAVDEARWRAAWDLKVFGYINMCRAFYPLLKARGGGVIVNVIGVGGVIKDPGYICGAGSNAAIYAFTQALGAESHLDNIRVVGVSPGAVLTERLAQMMDQRKANGETIKAADRRTGQPEEIAAAIAFVASGQASYLSGTVLNVDAGMSRL